MRLHADATGDGPALVLLHGFTGSSASWRFHREALGERFRVVTIDLPGHGRSPAPAGDLQTVAVALLAVLDRLGIDRAHWLGYSLGGRAALHVALADARRIDRLVLESTSPGIADAAARRERARADAARADAIERDGVERFVDDWMRLPLFATQRRLPPEVLARERADRLSGSPAGLAAALRTMGAGTQASLWERLASIAVPTLLIAGADDDAYRAHAAAMTQRMPRAETAIVAGAGHTVHLEQPVAFRAIVTRFLAEPPNSRP